MEQFNFKNNILNLKVKKSPLAVRIVMFFFAFAFFVFPILGTIGALLAGSGLQFSYLLGIGIFALMGFYLLRVSLWNTYGEETIEILENTIIYEVDYRWFKDGKKEITITTVPEYSFKSAGYEEDDEAVLVITSEESQMESVVKMPIAHLKELILILQTSSHMLN